MLDGRKYHKNNRLPFVVDQNSVIRTLGRQPNWDRVSNRWKYGAVKVSLTANRAVDATDIAVTALLGALPLGTLLDFGGKKFARLTAAAIAGAVLLSVSPLATALVTGDVAYGGGTGAKRFPAGTCICEDANGKIFPRADKGGGSETAYGFCETDVSEDSPTDASTGYGVIRGGSLFENMLPDAVGGPPKALPADYKTEMAANGAQFMFDTYADSRG